ncbi:hypothetical protein MTR_3g011490 [Medicago truncatula]|uniref:Uncharacterized protein n=1 Tax=Medicago truncatula TaxID=3880 RepID=A0A072V460_MEDTR|nr:hypothetical protein MTR_3g011490 [Medicago truncatula]
MPLLIRDDGDVGFMFRKMVENNILYMYVHSICNCVECKNWPKKWLGNALQLCRLTVCIIRYPRQLTAAGLLNTSVANCRRAFSYFTRVAQPNNMWEQQFSHIFHRHEKILCMKHLMEALCAKTQHQ